jgi:formate dehydrogenase subunit beta
LSANGLPATVQINQEDAKALGVLDGDPLSRSPARPAASRLRPRSPADIKKGVVRCPPFAAAAVKIEKIAWRKLTMTKKGDMLYAWTNDAEIQKKAELGGAVTALWKYALDSKAVDAVLVISKGKDLYDAKPVLSPSPRILQRPPVRSTAVRSFSPNSSRSTFDGAENMKIGVTVKGCDAMAFYELAKRKQINLDNIIMIGVNCGGSVSPVLARKMIADKYGVDPDTVHKEEIDKGQFIIEYEGGHKGISVDELEEHGYGRRPNCRRCKMKIPRQADLACGNWGVIGEKAGKATFVEVCSEKGANLVDGAVKAGVLATEPANPKGLEIRGKGRRCNVQARRQVAQNDFEALGEGKDRLKKIMTETSRCIKCYSVHLGLPDLLLC